MRRGADKRAIMLKRKPYPVVYVTEQRVQMYLHNNGALWKLTDKEKKKKGKYFISIKVKPAFLCCAFGKYYTSCIKG